MTNTRYLDAAPYRDNLNRLNKKGASISQLARDMGISRCAVEKIMNGKTTQIQRGTAKKLGLAKITPVAKTPHVIAVFPSRRRVQALLALGLTQVGIARGTGLSASVIGRVLNDEYPKINHYIATRIEKFYDEHKDDKPKKSRYAGKWPLPYHWLDIDNKDCRPLIHKGYTWTG